MKCPHFSNSELFSYHRWTACHLSQEGLARNWLCLKAGVRHMQQVSCLANGTIFFFLWSFVPLAAQMLVPQKELSDPPPRGKTFIYAKFATQKIG